MQKLPCRDTSKDQVKINLTRGTAKEVEGKDKRADIGMSFKGDSQLFILGGAILLTGLGRSS